MAGPWDNYGQSNNSGDEPWSNYGQKPPTPKSSIARRLVGDTAISALKSAIAVPEAAVGIADLVTGGKAGKILENEGGIGFRPKEAKATLDEYLSPEQKTANEKLAQADGFVDTLATAVDNPSTILHTGIESIAPMLAGGVVARGVMAAPGIAGKVAPWVAGAIGEGTISAGMGAESIRQQTEDGLLTGEQAGLAGLAGVGTGLIGAGGAKIAQKLGIGEIDTLLAGGNAGAATTKGIARKAAEGAAVEGVFQELPQSTQEQALQNIALGKPWDEGLGNAAAMGLLTGAALGGIAGPLGGKSLVQPTPTAENPTPAPVPAPDPAAGPISRTAAQLPGPSIAGLLPDPGQTLYGDAAGNLSPDGQPRNFDREYRPTGRERGPQTFGPGMDQQTPRGELPITGEVIPAARMPQAQAQPPETQRTFDAEPVRQALPDLRPEAVVVDSAGQAQVGRVPNQPQAEPAPRVDGMTAQAVPGQRPKFDQVLQQARQAGEQADAETLAASSGATRAQAARAIKAVRDEQQAVSTIYRSVPGANKALRSMPEPAGFEVVKSGNREWRIQRRQEVQGADSRPGTIDDRAAGDTPVVPDAADNVAREPVVAERPAAAGRSAEAGRSGVPAAVQGADGQRALSEPQTATQDPAQQDQPGLPEILATPRKRYIDRQAKASGIKKGSPGYDQAIQRLQNQYEADVDRASAGLTFEQYNALNSDNPASVNRQAWEALREEYGVADAEPAPSKQEGNKRAPGEAKASEPAAKPDEADAQRFIAAPDGSTDFGEITSDMAKAAGRQAGKIRLQQGNESWGLQHIEQRHGAEIRDAGFADVPAFVADIAQHIDQVWKPAATRQLVALHKVGNNRMMFVELQPGKDEAGDFYTVNTAFTSRKAEKKGWKLLWEARAQASGESGNRPSFAVSPPVAGGEVTNPSSQSSEPSIAPPAGDKPAAKPKSKPDAKLEDAGDQLKFNKKGMFRSGGLKWSDIASENDALKVKLAGKEKIWARPSWEQIIEAQPADQRDGFRMAAHLVKQVYDALPKQAPVKTDEGIQQYIEAVTELRAAAEAFLGDGDALAGVLSGLSQKAANRMSRSFSILDMQANNKISTAPLFAALFPEQAAGKRFERGTPANTKGQMIGSKAIKAMQWGADDAVKAMKAIKAGWPAKQEAWEKQGYAVHLLDSAMTGRYFGMDDGKIAAHLLLGGRSVDELGIFDTRTKAEAAVEAKSKELVGQFLVLDKRKRMLGAFLTEAEATDFARAQVARKAEPEQQAAEQASEEWDARTGEPRRPDNKDVSPEDLIEAFGFRGVNFGNWVKQGERRRHLNAAYDAFADLAELLGIPPKAVSLNGMLGVAFGAQGGGKFAAHFVPGVNEINITKTRGAGSLAHEWAHALDHYFGTQAGLARSANPFASTLQGMSKYARGKLENVQLRPEIEQAFNNIVDVMRSRVETPAEVVKRRQDALQKAKEGAQVVADRLRPRLEGNAEALKALDAVMEGEAGEYVNLPIPKGKRKPIGAIPENIKTVYDALGYSSQEAYDKSYQLHRVALAKEQLSMDVMARSVHTQFYRNSMVLDGKKTPYWSTQWEMFARGFESWVMDALALRGAANNYLVGEGKADEAQLDDSPYPRGSERALLNDAFGKLAAEIKFRQADDGNMPLFSRGPAGGALFGAGRGDVAGAAGAVVEHDAVEAIIKRIGDRLGLSAPIIAYRNEAALFAAVPEIGRQAEKDGAKGQVNAVFYRGKVHVVTRAFARAADVEMAILDALAHEGQGHHGIRAMYGNDAKAVDAALREVFAAIGGVAGVKRLAAKNSLDLSLYLKTADGMSERQRAGFLADELLAHLQGRAATAGLSQRAMAAIKAYLGAVREWLRGHGFPNLAKGTDADIALLLKRMREAAQRKPTGRGLAARFSRAMAVMQTETAAFKRWFGDSKVVDADGKPLVVYHGTTSDFESFDREKVKTGVLGHGFYFASRPESTRTYSGGSRFGGAGYADGGNVMPVYLSIKNPMILKRGDKAATGAEAKGHDGVIQLDAEGNIHTMVVFRPEQIKSAVGNNGEFDQGNPSILFRRAAGVTTDAFKRWFGASKVVNKQGEPKILYHGTGEDFTVFDQGRSGSSTRHNTAPLGIFMTGDRDTAQAYADKASDGIPGYARVMQLYAAIRNPYMMSVAESLAIASPGEAAALRGKLEREGYDGINLKGTDTWVAFSNTQVKSATDNNGEYDEWSGDIRFKRTADFADALKGMAGGTGTGRTADAFTDLDQGARDFLNKVGTQPAMKRASDWVRERTERAATKIRQGIVDRYAALKELDEKLLGKDFIENAIHNSSWVLARMSSAASGAMNAMLTTGRLRFDAKERVITLQDDDASGGLGAVLSQLGPAAEVERFMGWIAANRASKLMAEGRENLFTAEEIASGKQLNAGRTDDGRSRPMLYAQVFTEFQQYRDDVLAIAEATGIISAESRAMWRDEFYVPFYRVMNEDATAGGPQAGKGLSRQEAYKKLKGGKQNLNDLLENTLMNFHHLLSASLKNQAAAQTMSNAEKVGIARVVPESRRDPKTSTFVLEKGERVFYEIDDPLVFEALTALADPGLNNLAVQTMAAFKRFFTNMTTVTPQFILANTMRDLMQASATSPTSKNLFKNTAQGLAGYRDAKTRAQMQASGGAFSFGHLYGADVNEVKASLNRTVKGAQLITDPSMIPKILRAGWRKWGDVADTAENISRAATYLQNVEQKGRLRAAYEARDIMDFSQHGAWPAVRFLIRVVPFLNARLQGLDKLYRSGVKPSLLTAMGKGTDGDKAAAARFATVTGALTVASIALYLANADDDEYRKLEDWQKDSYWFFRIGDNAFFLPKPFEVGAIATMAERLTEQMVDDKATGKLFADRLKDMLTQTFSFSPVPQIFQPVLDIYSNKDAFTGRDIESMGMDRLSKGLRSRENTTAAATALSAVSRALGDESPVALSPVQADHLIRGYFGTVGATAAGLVDTIWRGATGQESPDKSWSEYQPIRRFYRDLGAPAPYTRYSTLFYEGLREANRVYADVRELQSLGKTDEAREVSTDKRGILAMRLRLNQQQRRISEINKQMETVKRSGNDGAWKRRELDRLTLMRNRITEQAGMQIENVRAQD